LLACLRQLSLVFINNLISSVTKGFGRVLNLKPAAHERTCRAYLLFVTSWIDKISSGAGNIYGIFVIRDM
jgi:hypothetical protein